MIEQQQYPTREQIAPLPDDARMEAYYYGFERTGVGFIDAILSAVAIAGKGAHHTESWAAPWDGTTDYFRGHPGLPDAEYAVDLIQKAAQQAADAVLALFPQQTPSAQPPTPDELFDLALNGGGSRADALVRIYQRGVADGTIAAPPSIADMASNQNDLATADVLRPQGPHPKATVLPRNENSLAADMAPGTTFRARYLNEARHGKGEHMFFVTAWTGGNPICVGTRGERRSFEAIDQSTIREVTPPPATPEAN